MLKDDTLFLCFNPTTRYLSKLHDSITASLCGRLWLEGCRAAALHKPPARCRADRSRGHGARARSCHCHCHHCCTEPGGEGGLAEAPSALRLSLSTPPHHPSENAPLSQPLLHGAHCCAPAQLCQCLETWEEVTHTSIFVSNSCWKRDCISHGEEQAVPTESSGKFLRPSSTSESTYIKRNHLMKYLSVQRH